MAAMAWTIRADSLELWPGLVLHGMGEVHFHVSWKYWKLTSSPNTSKLVLGPPDWSLDFFESQGIISGAIKPICFPKNDPPERNKSGKLDNLPKSSCFHKMASFFMPFCGPHAFCWAHFLENLGFLAPEMMPWLSKKSKDQSGGPRTNLGAFGDEVSFQ